VTCPLLSPLLVPRSYNNNDNNDNNNRWFINKLLKLTSFENSSHPGFFCLEKQKNKKTTVSATTFNVMGNANKMLTLVKK